MALQCRPDEEMSVIDQRSQGRGRSTASPVQDSGTAAGPTEVCTQQLTIPRYPPASAKVRPGRDDKLTDQSGWCARIGAGAWPRSARCP